MDVWVVPIWVLLWIVMLWILFSQILLLKYSWFTTLYQFLMDSKVIQLYINIYFFFSIFFPIIVYYKILNIGPCAIQQVLVVYFIYCRCLVMKSCLTLLWLHGLSSRPPGPSVHCTSQARILEWAAISFSRRSSWPRDRTQVSWTGKWVLYHCTTGKPTYKWCPVMFVFLSNTLHFLWSSLDPSTLLWIALFHSSYGWVAFHCVCINHIFFIHPTVNGHLGRSHVLAIVNSAAAINILFFSFSCHTWDLSFLTRDWTHAPCIGSTES